MILMRCFRLVDFLSSPSIHSYIVASSGLGGHGRQTGHRSEISTVGSVAAKEVQLHHTNHRCSARLGHLNLVRILLEYGVDPNYQNAAGHTPLSPGRGRWPVL